MAPYYDYGYDYGYGYDEFGGLFGNSDVMAALSMFLGIIAVFAIVTWAMSLVVYILRSIGLYKLSENRGMSGAALAWIPMIGFYRIGSVADDIVARTGGKSYYRHILLIGGIVNILGGTSSWILAFFGNPFLSGIFNGYHGYPYNYRDGHSAYFGEAFTYWGISMLLSLLSIALFVFMMIALNKIYKCYRPMSSTSWTVLSVIFPFMQSIFLFTLRNAAPADQWGPQGYYPPQNTMPNQNWQAPPPPPYLPYGQQPPVNGGYPAQQQGWQSPQQPPQQAMPYPPQQVAYQPPVAPNPSQETAYQPPVAPNPPEPWEIENAAVAPPPRAPWEQNNGDS